MHGALNVKHHPLSNSARALIAIALILNVSAFLFVAYVYPSLPNTVATHYGINGAPNAYGYKSDLLAVPLIFLAVFVLLLLILRFRYTLLERYPYLINLPSFVYRLGLEKDPAVVGEVIGRVFTVYSFSVLYISVLNLLVTTAVFWHGASSPSPRSLLPAIVVLVAVFVSAVLLMYRRIYLSFASKGRTRAS